MGVAVIEQWRCTRGELLDRKQLLLLFCGCGKRQLVAFPLRWLRVSSGIKEHGT